MKEDLLSRIRRLNKVLTESTTGIVSFDEMCELMYDMLDCNLYIFNRRGKLLAGRFDKGEEKPIIIDEESGNAYLPETYNDRVLTFSETHENLTYDSIREVFGEDYDMAAKFHTFIPVLFGGKRVATVLLARASKAFSDEDIAIAEYGATVVGIEVARGIAQEEEELDRQIPMPADRFIAKRRIPEVLADVEKRHRQPGHCPKRIQNNQSFTFHDSPLS